jgi:alpha-beta hydrolase superfamily lysophospholipase
VNPSVSTVESIRVEARVGDRLTLPGRAWIATRPRARIALVHGLCEHTGRYAALAGDLVAAGYTVAALDWPGHGEAKGRRGDVRSWIDVRDLVVPAIFAAARDVPHQPYELPHVLIGHSMGGLLALDFALAHPKALAAVAVSAPALVTPEPPRWKLALSQMARRVAPGLPFPIGFDAKTISRDPEVIAAREADPLVHDSISPRLYQGLVEAQRRVLEGAGRLAIPALVMQGADDRVVVPEGSRQFCRAAPAQLVSCVGYPGAYHEIFNDVGRDGRVRDLIDWLGKVLFVIR